MNKKSIKKNNKKYKKTVRIKKGGEEQEVPNEYKKINEEFFVNSEIDNSQEGEEIKKEDKELQTMIKKRNSSGMINRDSQNNFGEIKSFIESKINDSEKKILLQLEEINKNLMFIKNKFP